VIRALLALATIGGCAPGATWDHYDPSDDCAPGVIVVESGEDVPCDLVGGANTLTVIDVDRAWCDLHGGRWAALPIAGECVRVDF